MAGWFDWLDDVAKVARPVGDIAGAIGGLGSLGMGIYGLLNPPKPQDTSGGPRHAGRWRLRP